MSSLVLKSASCPILKIFHSAKVGVRVVCILFAAALSSAPAIAFAHQGKVHVDSFHVFNETPDFVDIELTATSDSAKGEVLCLGVIAKSADGSVFSQGFPTIVAPSDSQSFRLMSRVMRPSGLTTQQTDLLLVMVYPCSQGGVTHMQKFVWRHVWPETKTDTIDIEYDRVELSEAHPWQEFFVNLDDEDFAALDTILRKWNDPTERDQNGEWKLDSFRRVFVSYSKAKRDWKSDLQRINRWRAFNPKSAGAAIAEAKYWAAYARHILGDETRTQDDPVALRIFGERMQRAEQVLKDAKNLADNNPLWYEAYLDIADATKRDNKFIELLFNEAVRKFPNFQPLYLDFAKHWVPRSSDSAGWKKVDDVILQAVANSSRMDGTSNYAMLYAQISGLQRIEFDIFQDSLVSWAKMRDSFEDLVKRYPSTDNLNEFAALACQANDRNTFLKIRPQIINHIVPNMWPANYSYDLCDHRFLQKI